MGSRTMGLLLATAALLPVAAAAQNYYARERLGTTPSPTPTPTSTPTPTPVATSTCGSFVMYDQVYGTGGSPARLGSKDVFGSSEADMVAQAKRFCEGVGKAGLCNVRHDPNVWTATVYLFDPKTGYASQGGRSGVVNRTATCTM